MFLISHPFTCFSFFLRNEALRVAYIDDVETLKDGRVHKEFYSKLVKADINGKDKVLLLYFSLSILALEKKILFISVFYTNIFLLFFILCFFLEKLLHNNCFSLVFIYFDVFYLSIRCK